MTGEVRKLTRTDIHNIAMLLRKKNLVITNDSSALKTLLNEAYDAPIHEIFYLLEKVNISASNLDTLDNHTSSRTIEEVIIGLKKAEEKELALAALNGTIKRQKTTYFFLLGLDSFLFLFGALSLPASIITLPFISEALLTLGLTSALGFFGTLIAVVFVWSMVIAIGATFLCLSIKSCANLKLDLVDKEDRIKELEHCKQTFFDDCGAQQDKLHQYPKHSRHSVRKFFNRMLGIKEEREPLLTSGGNGVKEPTPTKGGFQRA